MTNKWQQAQDRVSNSETLTAFEAFIMYDWPEGDEHWDWVCTASEDDIIGWCEGCRDAGCMDLDN